MKRDYNPLASLERLLAERKDLPIMAQREILEAIANIRRKQESQPLPLAFMVEELHEDEPIR